MDLRDFIHDFLLGEVEWGAAGLALYVALMGAFVLFLRLNRRPLP